MSEEAASTPSAPSGDFDLKRAKSTLTLSSTSARTAQLRAIDDKISQKCELFCHVQRSSAGTI